VEAAAVIATLGSLLEGPLAAFLGAHIATVLPHLLSPVVLAARRPGGGAVGLAEQSAELRAMAAESIPARTLLPALVAQLPAAVDAGDASVAALLETVGVAVEAMDGAGVGQHSAAVFDFLLDCMDVRRKRHDHIAEQDRLDSATLRCDGGGIAVGWRCVGSRRPWALVHNIHKPKGHVVRFLLFDKAALGFRNGKRNSSICRHLFWI
jgi:hypothetical protein